MLIGYGNKRMQPVLAAGGSTCNMKTLLELGVSAGGKAAHTYVVC